MKPLAGLRVLDLTKVLAGPMCTQALASFGAGIIKVEPVEGGDESRFWAPVAHGVGAAFVSVNSGKRSIALNLKQVEGRLIVARLAAGADIIIESFAPGVAAKLGVDHDTLVGDRQDVICCSISGWGQRGPKSPAPGYDAILQAYSGLMAMNGEATRNPVRLPASPVDQVTGLYATQAILAAVIERSSTGKGCRIEVSLLESAIKLLAPNLQAYWLSGAVPQRSGSGHPSIAPYELFETMDRPVLVAVANEKFWRTFCDVAELNHLRNDARFATNPDRVRHRDALIALVADAMRSRTASDWMERLEGAGIPAAPLNSIADIANDPQAIALDMFRSFEHPDLGVTKTVREPVLFDGERADPSQPPPTLGQHTREILERDLAYSRETVDDLAARGIIAVGPEQETKVPA